MTDEQIGQIYHTARNADTFRDFKRVALDILSASIADTAVAKPVAWRWRLTAEINGKQWGPGPWEYTIYPEKFESRSIYEIEPLYATPASNERADAAIHPPHAG
jgi:hypothetical protein